MKDLYLFSCKREVLARKLETLPIKIPLKPIRPETALRRALTLNLDQKRYTFEESSFEKVNDKPVQIILINMKARYSVTAVVTMRDRGGVQLWNTSHWMFTRSTPGHG